MPVTMAFAARISPPMMPVDVAVRPGRGPHIPKAAAEDTGRRTLRRSIPATRRSLPAIGEREPDGRSRNLTGRTEQGEDAGPDHGADADEGSLTYGQVRPSRPPVAILGITPSATTAVCDKTVGMRMSPAPGRRKLFSP